MRRSVPLVLLTFLAGCGGPGHEQAVETADSWVRALKAGEFDAACALQLDVATRGVRSRYVRASPEDCESVMRAYRERISASKLRALGRLEAELPIKKDRIGVFPVTKRYQFEVLLMERAGGAWKIVSVGIPPDV